MKNENSTKLNYTRYRIVRKRGRLCIEVIM